MWKTENGKILINDVVDFPIGIYFVITSADRDWETQRHH